MFENHIHLNVAESTSESLQPNNLFRLQVLGEHILTSLDRNVASAFADGSMAW